MFSKKPHVDVKKSTQKFLDCRKDTGTRLKHLRAVLDNVDINEAKTLFETHFSHVYYVFYDQFITNEFNIKQRAHKTHKEELDSVLFLFEKILILLPELLARKWQCHSLGRIMKKLLHPGNILKLRRDAMRYFLLWYQTLGENAPQELHRIFSCLVPGLNPNDSLEAILDEAAVADSNTQDQIPVTPCEISYILLPQTGERQYEESLTRIFLEHLMDYMVTQVTKIEWHENATTKQQRCFHFLFERFKKHYLSLLFPDFSWKTNLYRPSLDLPDVGYASIEEESGANNSSADTKENSSNCKVIIIRWVANFTHNSKKAEIQIPAYTNPQTLEGNGNSLEQKSLASESNNGSSNTIHLINHERDSITPVGSTTDNSQLENSIVKETLYSSRENVNFVHEIFRQALLLPFNHATTIKKVLMVYRDWIDNKTSETPVFMLEPYEGVSIPREESNQYTSGDYSGFHREGYHLRGSRLRNDSYLGAIHRDQHVNVRAGMQNTIQLFVTHAVNVFLLEQSSSNLEYLDDQVDLCKRVLNIYRFMVMNIPMEQKTWEQLLLALLQITSLVLKPNQSLKKEDTLGGRLASALFQTLIVTWIKANLNVVISTELWDQFLQVLSSLTHWEELIREWAKTMDTLTRVLAKHVYGLDLNDLPLERLSEQKQKKRRGRLNPSDTRLTLSRNWSRHGSEPLVKTKRDEIQLQNTNSPNLSNTKISNRDGDFCKNNSNTIFYTADIISIPLSRQDRIRSSSGDHNGRRTHRSNSQHSLSLPRSISEGNLAAKSRSPSRRSSRESPDNLRGTTQLTSSESIPSNIEQVEKIMTDVEEYIKKSSPKFKALYRRSKSLDSLRFGRTSSSPSCMSESSGEGRSRSPSPSPSSGLESNSIKDSPMQIDMIGGDNSCSSDLVDGNREERCSIMAGGTIQGWLPDVAVVLWCRMLGALSDVNQIKEPEIHAQIFEYLIELYETLVKIRENQGVTHDNQSSPPPPEYIPPLHKIAPWLFKALTLSEKYNKGKLFAYRLLCSMTIRRQDIPQTHEHIVHFFRALHQGLVGTNQEVINTLVKYCSSQFFSCNIPGSTILIMDFIYAAHTIVSSNELKGVPRTEAVSILGSLLCFPVIYEKMQVLQPHASEFILIDSKDTMDHIVSVLLKAGKREPAGMARCIAICSIGIYLYEELVHNTFHHKMKDAITVLLTALRQSAPGLASKSGLSNEFNNKIVGQVASDMLLLLCDYSQALLQNFQDVPKKIIEVLCNTLTNLLSNTDLSFSQEDKKLLISLMFCLGEWCMRIPQSVLMQKSETGTSLLLTVFRVLNTVASGKWNTLSSDNVADLFGPEFDPNIQLDNLQDGASSTPGSPKSQLLSPMQDLVPLLESSPLHSSSNSPIDGRKEWTVVKLAARTIMNHLVNHLNHFPMGIGAARLTSMVNEHDDISGLHADELSTEIFHAPNVQFFVLNNNTLISFVELPSLDVPGGGVTAGLMTAKSQVRVITRNISGKFSWDCSVLHGSPKNMRSQSPESSMEWLPSFSQNSFSDNGKNEESLTSLNFLPSIQAIPRHMLRHRSPDVLPTAQNSADDMDNLDDLLQYIGHTSSECLERPGQPLNIPSPTPWMLPVEMEDSTITTVLNQRNCEIDFVHNHNNDLNMVSSPQLPSKPCDTHSPFEHCRMLLNQLGFMSWEKRSHFDLLKKDEKLLRELRNVDNQKCRETHKIAVVYVAKGQEDKNSVLLNTGGSQEYEEFVAGLAWEVELETHPGFMGGLQKNKSSGDTAPYYATSFMEVIFHVATRMPTSNEESKLQKLRHLGNDEIHIVWSEHNRDYRRSIIPTEFCDVLIVIYPLQNKLFRIQINRKPEVPFFGPLFNGAIVDHKVLPGLVRATALNASRAKRSMMTLYQNFYEERAKALDTIVQNHKDCTTFEAFTANVFAPAQPNQYGSSRALGSSFNKSEPCNQNSASNLAAALIDSHTTNTGSPTMLRNRPLSLSGSEQPSPREQHSRATHSFSYLSHAKPTE